LNSGTSIVSHNLKTAEEAHTPCFGLKGSGNFGTIIENGKTLFNKDAFELEKSETQNNDHDKHEKHDKFNNTSTNTNIEKSKINTIISHISKSNVEIKNMESNKSNTIMLKSSGNEFNESSIKDSSIYSVINKIIQLFLMNLFFNLFNRHLF